MVKNLSVTEFQRVCEQIAPVTFIFDTENQSDNTRLKMVSRYSDMIFMLSPNRICLKNNYGTLCFDRVSSIRYFDDRPSIGAVFDIICESYFEGNSTPISYTIIADRKNTSML